MAKAYMDSNSLKDSQQFIINRFATDYPQYRMESYAHLMKFIGSSSQLKLWHADVKTEHLQLMVAPSWFKEVYNASEWGSKFLDLHLKYEGHRKDLAYNISVESVAYNTKCEVIRKEFYRKKDELLVDPISKIAVLTAQELPADIIFRSLSMGDKSVIEGQPSEKKNFLDSSLNSFKTRLLKMHKEEGVNFKLSTHVNF
jgi:hypothetical protein